jgi:hypothetical protein
MRCLVVLVVLLATACADTGAQTPKEYAVPDRLLGYTYSGGTIRPIPNTQTGIVRGSSLQSAY